MVESLNERWLLGQVEDVLDVGCCGCQPPGESGTDGKPGWNSTATDFQSRCLDMEVSSLNCIS